MVERAKSWGNEGKLPSTLGIGSDTMVVALSNRVILGIICVVLSELNGLHP